MCWGRSGAVVEPPTRRLPVRGHLTADDDVALERATRRSNHLLDQVPLPLGALEEVRLGDGVAVVPVLLLGAQGNDHAAKRQEQSGDSELLAADGAAEAKRARLLGRGGGNRELSAKQVQELALCRADGEADGLLGDVPGVSEGAVVGGIVGDELEFELLGLGGGGGGLCSQEERGRGGGGGVVGSLLGGLHWFKGL